MIYNVIASDDFFGKIKRAKIFELTDFKVPKITINLSEEDYYNFFLRYQCEYDMNARYVVRNDECYKAPWVDLDSALNKAVNNNLIDKSRIEDKNDLALLTKANITLTEFEHIVTKYTDFSLEEILVTGYGLIKIPDYSVDDVGLTFDLDGYMFFIYIYKYNF